MDRVDDKSLRLGRVGFAYEFIWSEPFKCFESSGEFIGTDEPVFRQWVPNAVDLKGLLMPRVYISWKQISGPESRILRGKLMNHALRY